MHKMGTMQHLINRGLSVLSLQFAFTLKVVSVKIKKKNQNRTFPQLIDFRVTGEKAHSSHQFSYSFLSKTSILVLWFKNKSMLEICRTWENEKGKGTTLWKAKLKNNWKIMNRKWVDKCYGNYRHNITINYTLYYTNASKLEFNQDVQII